MTAKIHSDFSDAAFYYLEDGRYIVQHYIPEATRYKITIRPIEGPEIIVYILVDGRLTEDDFNERVIEQIKMRYGIINNNGIIKIQKS